MLFSDSGFTVVHRKIGKYIEMCFGHRGFSFAPLDSLVPYAAVLSVARQRLKKSENPPSFLSTLYFEQAFLFLPDPVVL